MAGRYDVEFPMLLTLEEAARGARRDVVFPRPDMLCLACSGSGQAGERSCAACSSTGRASIPRVIALDVPPGADTLTTIRIPGEGLRDAANCSWGDLLAVCYVRPHQTLRRDGHDVIAYGVVDSADGSIRAASLDGPIVLDRPPHVEQREIRLPGRGMPHGPGGRSRGDLVVIVNDLAPEQAAERAAAAASGARRALRAGDPARAIRLLSDPALDAYLSAEGHSVLGQALAREGRCEEATAPLQTAVRLDPTSPVHRCNVGRLAAMRGATLQACVWFESALRRTAGDGAARSCLREALAALAAGLPEAPEVGALAQQGSYASAAAVANRVPGGGAARLAAQLLVLSCYRASEERLGEAAKVLCVAGDPSDMAAVWVFADSDCGPAGLLGLAECHLECGDDAGAVRALRLALARTRERPVSTAGHARGDVLVAAERHAVRLLMTRLARTIAHGSHEPRSHARMRGLFSGVAALQQWQGGDSLSAFGTASEAVVQLEGAVLDAPDDRDVLDDLCDGMDIHGAIATAFLNERDPALLEFIATTHDALRNGIVPHQQLRNPATPGSARLPFLDELGQAFCRAFADGRTALRGEFLVGVLPDHYVLTNYRLVWDTDRLPFAQHLPLNVVTRYVVRPEGLNVSTVIVGTADGRQLALNGIADGTYPPEDLVGYLIAARMWDQLRRGEQAVLAAGTAHAARVASSDEGTPPGEPPPGDGVAGARLIGAERDRAHEPTTCSVCGAAPRTGDVFCRKCGGRLGASQALTPRGYIGSGER